MTKIARLVSEKAYKSFTERIRIVSREPERMIAALDLYLTGDRANYADRLTESEKMAFEMLRFEIDRAIDRSARARERARARRQTAGMSEKPVCKADKTVCEDTEYITPPETPEETVALIKTLMTSRRIRRANDRQKRPKTKWRKIG